MIEGSPFILIADPSRHSSCDWDFADNPADANYWIDLFEHHFEEMMRHGTEHYGLAGKDRIAAAKSEFAATIAALRANHRALPGGRFNIVDICRMRQDILHRHDIGDPFSHVKKRENITAAKLYPQVIARIDAIAARREKFLTLIRCILAGNIFDLGACATMGHANKSPDFIATEENLSPRPWLIDDFDAFAKRLSAGAAPTWKKAVMLIDNSGCDFVLGIMPLARQLAMEGTQIVLAANELPSLNDMTATETVEMVKLLAGVDEKLAAMFSAGAIKIVSTGNDLPVIDLSRVSPQLNAAADGADLLVIEGMGRGVETNLEAEMSVDYLRIAMLKDERIAEHLGGGLYDCVCRFTPRK